MRTIAIFGASGHGKVVADLAELIGYKVTFFDDAYPNLQTIEHWPVEGNLDYLLEHQNQYEFAVVAIGNNHVRNTLSLRLINAGFEMATLIHPSSVISKYSKVGDGSVIFANTVVNAFAQIGGNCVINTSSVIEHDCIVGEAVHISPNVSLAGGTKVGDLSWLGIGTVTKQSIEIGNNVTVGANSTVIENIPSDVIAVGTPATIKKYL